jgi:hypothetical protein
MPYDTQLANAISSFAAMPEFTAVCYVAAAAVIVAIFVIEFVRSRMERKPRFRNRRLEVIAQVEARRAAARAAQWRG